MAPEGGDAADSSIGAKKIRRRLRKSSGEALESEKTADPSSAKEHKEAKPSSQHGVIKRKRNDERKYDIDSKDISLHQRQKESKIGDGIGSRGGKKTEDGIVRHEERKINEDGREDKKTEDGIGRLEGRKEKNNGDGRHGSREDRKIGNGIGRHEGWREQKTQDGRHEGRREMDESIAGAIFMCNNKTKPDCFRYSLMGVSSAKQDSMMRIRPGVKLFLYNFDLRVLYGIFEASSGGGSCLDPAAFGGFFQAQVRFKIHKDCLPLPDSAFRKAVNYDNKTRKFDTELTMEQVKKLTELFLLNPLSHAHQEFVQSPIVRHPPSFPSKEILRQQHHREEYDRKLQTPVVDRNGHFNHTHDAGHSQDPLFLTEREYRIYGLRGERPNSDPAPYSVAAPTTHTYENFRFDYAGEQPQSIHPSMTSNMASVQSDQGCPSMLFLSEKEYRAFGLKSGQQLPGRQTTEDMMKGAYNPYDDSTASVVSRYLTLPGPVASTAGTYVHASSSRPANELGEHSLRLNPEIDRLRAPYLPHYHKLGGNSDPLSASVSSRYSFGGPLPRR